MDQLEPLEITRPPVFIENNKICGIASVGNGPKCVYLNKSDNLEEIYLPPFFDFLNYFKPRYCKLKGKVYHFHEHDNSYVVWKIQKPKKTVETYDDRIWLNEWNLLTGLFKFYNEYLGMRIFESVETEERYNQIFNDASIESMFRTVLIYPIDIYPYNTIFPIPFKFDGIVDDIFFFKPLMPEHNFIVQKEKVPYKLFHGKDFVNSILDKDPNLINLEFLIDTQSQYLPDIKKQSKNFYKKYGL